MTSLGFENYGEALKIYLARYREVRDHHAVGVVLTHDLQNMVARGEHQRPATSGAGATTGTTAPYDGANHNAALGNTLDTSGEAVPFAYDSAADY